MPGQEKPPKDFWDKVDIAAKIFSGLVLALIALVLQRGSAEISSSLNTGNLIQSLISDLTTKEKTTRRDLALIALDYSVDSKHDKLVAEIAKRVIEDSTEKDPFSTKPWEILKKRDLKLAQEVKTEIENRGEAKASKTEIRETLVSKADPPKSTEITQQIIPKEVTQLSRIKANVVYIQYNGSKYQELADALRKKLKDKGYVVPRIEQVDSNHDNRIRYFNEEDGENASKLSSLVEDFLKEREIKKKIAPKDFVGRFEAPRGQLEVWLNIDKP